MTNLIVEVSKYLMILLMAIYTYANFRFFSFPDLERKRKVCARQNRAMFLLHFLAYLVMYLKTEDETLSRMLLVFYIGQVVFFLLYIYIYRFIYRNVSRLLVNNCCMLLACGFIMLTRLSLDKGLDKAFKQFVIVAAAAVALGVAIAAIVASLGGSFSKKGSSGGGSSGGGSSGSGSMGSVDITTGTGSLEDAINANTKALEKTNSALADMIRQAGALVLSDNMRLGSTVAASGTAQVVSAANSYHREGDTNITQNIYSKAQTAADLQREARWEADKAKARKR